MKPYTGVRKNDMVIVELKGRFKNHYSCKIILIIAQQDQNLDLHKSKQEENKEKIA